jgi:hypothetical protein
MVRAYADARVTRVPTAEEIAAVERQLPDTRVQLAVREAMRLSELRDQDSYSFEVATVFVGADSQGQLEAKFQACMDRLPLVLEPLGHA